MSKQNIKINDNDSKDSQNSNAPAATYLSDEELEYFRNVILKKRREAMEEIEEMSSRLQDAQEQAEGYTYHMADSGTDAMEREMLYLMISRQQKFVGYLDRALKRIELKTYGVCKITGKPIPKERLEVVPHTETTVEAKLEEKKKNSNKSTLEGFRNIKSNEENND